MPPLEVIDRALLIRTAIGNALKAQFAPGYQVSEYLLGNPSGPGFEVDIDPEGIDFDQAMARGLDQWHFLVRGFVAQTTDVGSQQVRDRMIMQVKAAIEVDRTLGGVAHAVRVIKFTPRTYGTTTGAGAVTYTGGEWRVRVMATG